MSDLNNLGNPQNNLHDWEEQNAPHVTPIPREAGIRDDMFCNAPIDWDAVDAADKEGDKALHPPKSPRDDSGWNG